MSIQVSCQCGKTFQVGDQFAGKRGKCKACGAVVTVPLVEDHELAALLPVGNEPEEPQIAPTPPPEPKKVKAPRSSAFDGIPPLRGSGRKQNNAGGGGIHISPGLAAIVALVVIIPTTIFVVKQGPVKANAEWADMHPAAENNIISQLTRALHHEYRVNGLNGVNADVLLHTKATTITFDEPPIMFALPDSMTIQGFTTEGQFRGEFHPRTLTFDADVEVFGAVHKVSGSARDNDQSLQMDGQPVNDW
jgi:hypothetical protein